MTRSQNTAILIYLLIYLDHLCELAALRMHKLETHHPLRVITKAADSSAKPSRPERLVQKCPKEVEWLDPLSGMQPWEGLVRPAQEFAKSVTETSSKVREPKTYDKAINDPISGNRWREAIDEELWNLDSHQTWSYTALPSGRKAIGCKWVFRVKYHPDGSIERYKARLVAQGFAQVHGIDYTETFAPTIRRESLRIFLAITALLGMILLQMDVIGAYLESPLGQDEHPIYLKIPQGCKIGREGLVCKILKSLYGLKQAGRLWNKTLIKFFRTIGFVTPPTQIHASLPIEKITSSSL